MSIPSDCPCGAAPVLYLTTDGRWMCRTHLERAGATQATPSTPAEPEPARSYLR